LRGKEGLSSSRRIWKDLVLCKEDKEDRQVVEDHNRLHKAIPFHNEGSEDLFLVQSLESLLLNL
jgi:hypothetical protein